MSTIIVITQSFIKTLYSYNNQANVVLIDKHLHRSKEQNTEPRNRSTLMFLTDFAKVQK